MANNRRDAEKERFRCEALARRAKSGLSVRAFCRRERLAESAFYAWRRTIGERDGKSVLPPKSRATKRIAFVPAVVTDEPRRESGVVIELIGGRVLRLP
jgi:transposase